MSVALHGLAGIPEIQGTMRGKQRKPPSVSGVSLLSTGFGWGSVPDYKQLQSEAWMIFIVTLVLLQANGTVFLNREQRFSLIRIICISDEWEEWNDSFTGQLFIYLLPLFLEKWKCIIYGILHYWPEKFPNHPILWKRNCHRMLTLFYTAEKLLCFVNRTSWLKFPFKF